MGMKKFKGFNNIILCTDFSDPSGNVFSYAFSLAKHYNATLHILHVVDTTFDGEPENATLTDHDKEVIESAEKELQKKFSKRLHDLPKHKTVVLMGIPHEVIIDYAKEIDADLVVMGASDRSVLSRVFLGSTTERVFKKVHCPVLPIRL